MWIRRFSSVCSVGNTTMAKDAYRGFILSVGNRIIPWISCVLHYIYSINIWKNGISPSSNTAYLRWTKWNTYVHLIWRYECAMCMFTTWFLKVHIESVFANAFVSWFTFLPLILRLCCLRSSFVLCHICVRNAHESWCLREKGMVLACRSPMRQIHTCNVFDVRCKWCHLVFSCRRKSCS